MAFHPDITRKDDVTVALDTANAAVRIASKQLTGNAGTVEIPNADGTSTIMGVGAGDTTVAKFVGDTTAPGKPTGMSVSSRNAAVFVGWDGSMEGGVPFDWGHLQLLATDDKGNNYDFGVLYGAGSQQLADLTPGAKLTVWAIGYDDAHDAQGNSTPNASTPSDKLTVTVESAVDPNDVEKAQSDAQTALNQAGQAVDTATAAKQTAQGAQTTADGKNKIFSAASEPAHTGLVPGDLWFQLDSSKHVTGIQVWNGSAFVDYVLMANQILVAGSVGTVQLANGAVTANQITASEALLKKLLVRNISADEIDVGGLAAAIVTSGLFQTASSGARVKMDSSGITGYNSTGATTFKIDAATGDVSMIGKFYSGDKSVSRVIIDSDYNNIGIPKDANINVDGYIAFESHSSEVSPFIGGIHGTTAENYTGSIMTSGMKDAKNPQGANVQLQSFGDGAGAQGALVSAMDGDNLDENVSRVDVRSDKDGQSAALRAYGGTGDDKHAGVEARADSDGHYSVAIVATDIFQIDPVTGRISKLVDGDGAWVVCYTGNFYYRPQAGSGLQALSVCKRFGVVELMGRIAVGGTVQANSDMGEMIPVSYRPTAVTMIQCDQSQWGTAHGPSWFVRPDGHIIWGPHQDNATDATFHGIWVGA